MTMKRIPIMLVALCALAGAAVGGAASMPVAAPSAYAPVSSGPAATDASVVTDTPIATLDGSVAADSTERVSDCDLVDIDGNDNTIAVNISANTTAGDGVSIQYHCGAGDATTVDHDLIDVDGHNNAVTVAVQVENGAIVFGENGSATDKNGLHVALNCGGGTVSDCDAVDIDGTNNSVTLVVRSDDGQTVHEFGAVQAESARSELGENDEDDDNDGAIDEDDEDHEGPSNDDDDGDGCIDEDDEPDDGDDGADDFAGNAEDDDDGDGCIDEDDEADSGNSDDIDNDGDGAVDEDDEKSLPERR
ncbi:MAG TPA: hypothetical protein VFJ06_12545 [Halococcus sp.]|nr:hypothetical protein [Halococcus sp.]